MAQAMSFKRRISVKHSSAGDAYVLSIPVQVAQVLGVDENGDGGLISIEVIPYKSYINKREVLLRAYRDSDFAWREQLLPDMKCRTIPIPPQTLGPSRQWACGEVTDFKQALRELRASRLWITQELRKAFPPRRGRRRRR